MPGRVNTALCSLRHVCCMHALCLPSVLHAYVRSDLGALDAIGAGKRPIDLCGADDVKSILRAAKGERGREASAAEPPMPAANS